MGNISTQYLIENKFLVPPFFGYKKIEGFDFSKCKPNNMGEFNGAELQRIINQKKRLTWEILQEVQEIMKDRNSAMIFCSTKAHCYEALAAFPEGTARIILGDTPDEIRNESLNLARTFKIKWLISVNCLLTGVNITSLNGIVWLRPTSSLLLFIQGIGRGLRLHDGKEDCLVLDYASNLSRFADFDHPIINEALKPKEENEQDYCIPCYSCHGTLNTVYARRCIGMVDGKRCEHYFEWKECHQCQAKNDQCSRECRQCQAELIDPNAKLTRLKAKTFTLTVNSMDMKVIPQGYTSNPIINANYRCVEGDVHENYYSNSEKNKNILYAKFVRLHIDKASDYYMHLQNINKMREMISDPGFKCPRELVCTRSDEGFYKIVKKVFD